MIRWGEGIFDCVRISLDVTKPLARFASLIKDGKRGVFQVTYEEGTASLKKNPRRYRRFCVLCRL